MWIFYIYLYDLITKMKIRMLFCLRMNEKDKCGDIVQFFLTKGGINR